MDESNPRRSFPRIFLAGIHDLREITGARVEWETAQRTDILDMSYSGMAVNRPSGIEFEKGRVIRAKILFAGQTGQEMEFELVRESEKIFGVHFVNLTKENVDAMDAFLSDKILGRSVRAVSPKFFNANHDFDQWLHGPNNTNIYIWMNDHTIRKAVLELAGSALLYENGKFSHQKLLMRPEDAEYVVFPLAHAKEVKDLKEFLFRSLKILSQIEEAPAQVFTLIDIIKAEAEKK
jgi:PilZ domain